MTTEDLRRIAGGSGGNTFNDYNIRHVDNLNPKATTVVNLHYVPVRPMFISKIINKLYELYKQNELSDKPAKDFDLDNLLKKYRIIDKMSCNRLVRWEKYIKDYAPYREQLYQIYQGFEDLGQNKRETLYRWLNREYRRLHDKWDADELFDALKDYVVDKMNGDITLFDGITFEEMDDNVCIVLVDAFIECRIFEKPS